MACMEQADSHKQNIAQKLTFCKFQALNRYFISLFGNWNMITEHSKSQFIPTHVNVFTKDVHVKKPSLTPQHKRAKRKNVEYFSEASQKRLLHLCRNSGHWIKSQIALTYHFACPNDGAIVRQQRNSFLTLMRERYPDIKYIWVLEFQGRGIPHYHLFTSICPSKVEFREWAAITWNRICGESPEHLAFQGHPKNFIPWCMASGKYLAKEYLAKANQKNVPEDYSNVGRFWGNSRNMVPEHFTIQPGVDCSHYAFNIAVRIVTKLREKILKKWIKKNYRKYAISYTIPNLTDVFIRILQFYEEHKENERNNRRIRMSDFWTDIRWEQFGEIQTGH